MRIVLTIFCGLVLLFAGGCALVLVGSGGTGSVLSSGPAVLIPGGIAVLNGLVIAALWGFAKPVKGVFLTLIILDAIVVAILLLLWSGIGLSNSNDIAFAALTTGTFALKGILTFLYWRKL